jgi:Zn-dependent alcohol dehydrogenase
MPQYIEFYRQGRLKLDEMITTRMKPGGRTASWR